MSDFGELLFFAGILMPLGTTWVIYNWMAGDLKKQIEYQHFRFEEFDKYEWESPSHRQEELNKLDELDKKLNQKKIYAVIVFYILLFVYSGVLIKYN